MSCRRIVRTVVVDASVLINVLILSRLDLLGTTPDLEFVVPSRVVHEITRPEQAAELSLSLASGVLSEIEGYDSSEWQSYVNLRKDLGAGEAACLALAASREWLVACDERGRFRRRAEELLGKGRIVTTPGLIVLAIRAGLITVDEADQMKATLEQHRFRMPFDSFRERIT